MKVQKAISKYRKMLLVKTLKRDAEMFNSNSQSAQPKEWSCLLANYR